MTAKQAEGTTQPSGRWTVETLKEYTTGMIEGVSKAHDIQMVDLKEMLRARFDAQEKAGQIAFTAQQTALTAGLTAAERGVETALAAAKEATNKAEVNANSRFEQFRSESNLQLQVLSGKLDNEIGRVTAGLSDLARRLDATIGRGAGVAESQANTRLDNGQLLALGGFLVAITAVCAGLFLK